MWLAHGDDIACMRRHETAASIWKIMNFDALVIICTGQEVGKALEEIDDPNYPVLVMTS